MGLRWDKQKRRYVRDDGSVVQQRTVSRWVDEMSVAVGLYLMAQALKAKNSPTFANLHDWASDLRSLLPPMHRATVIVSAGGVSQMTDEFWSFADERVAYHENFLDNFSAQVLSNQTDVDDAFVARSSLYAAAIYSSYMGGVVLREQSAGMNLYKRNLTVGVEHCEPDETFPEACPQYAERGWQQIGSLPQIGEECPCRARCRCFYTFRQGSLEDIGKDASTDASDDSNG